MSDPRETADWTSYSELSGTSEKTVVLAGTDNFSRRILAQRLRFSGYGVLEAPNGRLALDMVREHHPDLLVADWDLSVMSGEDLCRRIKSDPETSNTFVILLVDKLLKRRGSSASQDPGADEYVVVPCEPREVTERVRSLLRFAETSKLLAQRNEDYRNLATRLNQELTVVAGIQRALLPQKPPSFPRMDFSCFYLPSSECGGDYYDLHQLDDRHLGFVIADVSGHGAPAMVAMALIRQSFHIIADRFLEPHLLLEELNRMLYEHLPTDQYATMFYIIIDTETFECSYASAGHNPPIWFKAASNETTRLENCEGYPLKLVIREATYSSHTIQLSPGDRLVFYTDGIPECFNPEHEMYGMERFEESIRANAQGRTPRQLETTVVTDVMCFADNHPQEDDLTLTVLGIR